MKQVKNMKVPARKISNKKYVRCKRKREIKEQIEKRYKVLSIIIILVMIILGGKLFYIQVAKHSYYVEKVTKLTENIKEGSSTPRGRIYDRNGKLIVDNEAIKVITYKRTSGTKVSDEIKMAYALAQMIDIDISKLKETELKNFWILNNENEAQNKITKEEWQSLKERRIASSDIKNYKIERVTEEELSKYNELDKKAAYIYFLMNQGYAYNEKIIKKYVTDLEYALVASNLDKLSGFDTKVDWDRVYKYGGVFRSILGNVSTSESGIPYELKDYYLSKGYSLDDRVGTSYLEYQYEDILKGKKAKYKVSNTDNNVLIEEGSRGNDIMLTIDIELQKAVEEILEREVVKAKSDPNTRYYNKSFVIVSNPNTGEIYAMAGKQLVMENGEYKVYDFTPGIISSSVVAGSIVKGASHIVGYNTGALKIGEVRNDSCIKVAGTPKKCSFKYLGNLNDITALKQSSNTYQFHTAIKVGHGTYAYNKPLVLDESAFNTYRKTFEEFGLGVKTEIDLPNEKLGVKGTSTSPGLLLDFAIGQYDTYTPIQLNQYMNTIANGGKRLKPYLLKAVYEPTSDALTKVVSETEPKVLNTINTEDKYLERVKLGFKAVMEYGGTGSGYISHSYKPAGKTGTSQALIDTDGDGKVDTETLSNTFSAYAPYDNPVVNFTVISPNMFSSERGSNTRSYVNIRIAKEVSKKFFEIYQ